MPVPSLPNLAPPFALNAPLNCTFKIKTNTASNSSNALGNRVFSVVETDVQGWAIRESSQQLLNLIGAAPEEMALKVWIQNPKSLPANFASFDSIKCSVTFSGITQAGIFRPVPLGHPFLPTDFQMVIGAFKGAIG